MYTITLPKVDLNKKDFRLDKPYLCEVDGRFFVSPIHSHVTGFYVDSSVHYTNFFVDNPKLSLYGPLP